MYGCLIRAEKPSWPQVAFGFVSLYDEALLRNSASLLRLRLSADRVRFWAFAQKAMRPRVFLFLLTLSLLWRYC